MKTIKQLVACIGLFMLSIIANGQNTYPWPSTGSIGIGTTSPNSLLKLDISGALRTRTGFIVDATTGDFTRYFGVTQRDVSSNGNFANALGDGQTEVFSAGSSGMIVGTNNTAPLAFATSDIERMRITSTGYIGIGTTSPSVKLDVVGAISIQNGNNLTWGGAYGAGIPTIAGSVNSGLYFYPLGTTVGATFGLESDRSFFYTDLTVRGAIKTKKVNVTQTDWPDYVFHPSYELKPLSEVAQFIKTNHHLPDVPSAKEVEENGISLGDNQVLLLKKIEELTLYLIEMKTENNSMKDRIQQLESRLKK